MSGLLTSARLSAVNHAPEPAAHDAEKVNILVVDDLPEKLLAYEVILEELGQNMVTARSGEEALKLVLRQDFAVILLDVNMPGMDGFETASLIRQRRKSAHTPIIFLTAFTDEMRMAQGYASGAVDYLPTPVVPEVLKAKVRVFIELSQMRRQAALQAEEHAMRKAAEESARRSEFLVTASELLTRPQKRQDIMHTLAQLPLPYLADASLVWLIDTETQKTEIYRAYLNSTGQAHSETLSASLPAELEKALREAVASGQNKLVSNLPGGLIQPDSWHQVVLDYASEKPAQSCCALILPFGMRGPANGCLVLMRKEQKNPYAPSTIALATELVSHASVALENAILMHRIQEADRRKDEFLAMLAHELRNPLAPIRNALYVMKLSNDPNMRQQAEDTIERQLKQMVHLVDDLMDVSRITQGKIELRKERIQLAAAIQHAAETAQSLLRQRDHHLHIQLPKQPIWLEADVARISQIFSNILNNAAKYTNPGGKISVEAELLGDKVTITVSDNGIGIPPDMLTHIFDMFSQVDSSLERAQGGLGIGLTLVKSLVEMHGGTIEAQSRGLNEGSSFTVTLPVAHTEEEAPAAETPPVETPAARLKVLVVDDNEASAKTLGWMIELFGHEVHMAHDSYQALTLADAILPDVILLDIGLPNMNGYEVCKTIRAKDALKHTVLIAQTGWGQSEHRQRSREAGFNHHLVKPIDMKTLQELIGSIAAPAL